MIIILYGPAAICWLAVAALLAVEEVAAFVSTKSDLHVPSGICPRSFCEIDEPFPTNVPQPSKTTLFADSARSSTSSSYTFDEEALRFAYDEWRMIHGKGDFDRARYMAFKGNYQALTTANLEAREKAAREGRPAPAWMSLNEYGDYTVDEYQAMQRGNQVAAVFGTVAGDGTFVDGATVNCAAQDSYGRPVRPTQVVQQKQSTSSTSYGTQVVSSSTPSYSNFGSGGGESQMQDQFGRPIRSTQTVRTDSSSSSSNNSLERDASIRGTQVIRSEEGSSSTSPKGTLVIKHSDEAPSSRGTMVLSRTDNPSNMGSGTRVIRAADRSTDTTFASTKGTQVIKPADSVSELYSSSTAGTQVIRRGGGPTSSSWSSSSSPGTQVIQPVDSLGMPYSSTAGTQVIKTNGNYDSSLTTAPGTQVLQQADVNSGRKRGTLIISKDGESEEVDNFDDSVTKRGTMVIKKQIPEPKQLPSLFDLIKGTDNGKDETRDGRGTIVIKGPEKDSSLPKPLSSLFGGISTQKQGKRRTGEPRIQTKDEKPSIFSLFSGKRESDENRSVRGTITIPKNGKQRKPAGTTVVGSKEKTLLVDKNKGKGGPPSILSFFGGAKKVTGDLAARNPNARPTLTIKKPTSAKNSPSRPLFSIVKTSTTQLKPAPGKKSASPTSNAAINAKIAVAKQEAAAAATKKEEVIKQREARRKELQERRREATLRREERAKSPGVVGASITKDNLFNGLNGKMRRGKGTVAVAKKNQPLYFFGSKQTIPEVENWRQNPLDGSITGYIYNSKSFEDGTRVTTSQVQRGAKRGTTVTTSAGTKYFLK